MFRGRRSPALVLAFFVGILLLAAMAGSALLLGIDGGRKSQAIRALEVETGQIQAVLLALVDAQAGFASYLSTGNPNYLEPYYQGLDRERTIEDSAPGLFAAEMESGGSTVAFADLIHANLGQLALGIAEINRNGPMTKSGVEIEIRAQQIMDAIRKAVDRMQMQRQDAIALQSRDLAPRNTLAFMLAAAAGMIAIALSVAQFFAFNRQLLRRETSETALHSRGREIELSADMTNALQSVPTREESLQVIADYASRIVNEMTGSLYTYNNSRDQLVQTASWGNGLLKTELVESFMPDECWALRRGAAYLAYSGRPGVNCHHVRGSPHSYLCEPIAAQGAVFGVLHLASPGKPPEHAFATVKETARALANRLSLALANIDLRERLQGLAIRDPLTGLFNRRVLDEILIRELGRADRAKSRLGVAMVDIDHFKNFNDQFGHKAGDTILKEISGQIAKKIRVSDLACRYGGEEFVVLLPDIDSANGLRVCEKLREGIATLEPTDMVPGAPRVTISVGFSLYPDLCKDAADLIASADRALYASKHNGRNKVTIYDAAVIAPFKPANAHVGSAGLSPEARPLI
ncbi:GGDEF domain-containing protein [Hypericibacter terrae]|uniref:diguanylate cyclase n=1 Tax=Hypericibacter terrae TaxID=2602015 RepID=A0A5J6MKW5_9PROT|nr:diguanylate cyclase [Hypericibacter terrae]QEX17827.1 GGDEF domain-containing protein [Hypericibacter terrae]